MPVGNLRAAYAYHVIPKKTERGAEGGAISITSELATALDSTFDRSKVATAPVVSFNVDTSPGSRQHVIRDAALKIAFTDDIAANSAGLLALRLADIMDKRSSPTLLLVSVHDAEANGKRRCLLWTFPQQEVFDLDIAQENVRLNVRDAFIRESSLRKVAFLEGRNDRTGMLTARVLDFQASSTERTAADLWIVKYLDARLQMSGPEGTRLLARAMRTAFTRTAGDQQAHDELSAGISAIRTSPRRRWSINDVSSTYLGPVASAALTTGLGAEVPAAPFDLDRPIFDAIVQYKRFTLDNGIVVSAPFAEMDNNGGIELTDTPAGRHLKVEGQIEEEQVRSRG